MAAERHGRLREVIERAPATRSLVFDLDQPLRFAPGQFVSCLLPIGPGGSDAVRPYTIASHPETPQEIELLLNLVPGGPGSTYLFSLAPGAELRFTGPWGTFTLERPPAVETVFVADATAIAPIRPMLARAAALGHTPLRLLHAAASPAQFCYRDEIDALAAACPRLAVERVGSAALRDTVVARFVDADTDRTRHFYLCGVGAIVHELRDRLRAAGYARRAVQYERW